LRIIFLGERGIAEATFVDDAVQRWR